MTDDEARAAAASPGGRRCCRRHLFICCVICTLLRSYMFLPHPPHPRVADSRSAVTRSFVFLSPSPQVLPQVLPKVQPKLPEERWEPSRHEAFSGETLLPVCPFFLFFLFLCSFRQQCVMDTVLTSWKSLSRLFCTKPKP